MTLLKAYHADGTVKAVWREEIADNLRDAGAIPQRASRVEVITEGPNRALFHVDFSPLFEITANPTDGVCLTRTFKSYAAAVAAEVAWLEQNWVVRPGR